MEANSEERTAPSLRQLLTARPGLEPLLFVGLALVYSWLIRPTREDWLRIPFLVVIVLIPFASNLLHRDRLPEIGLRLDNLRASSREVGLATVIGGFVILAVGALTGGPHFRSQMIGSFFVYPFWGLIQQYAMQSFTYRRLRQAVPGPGLAAAAAAVLFASLHWPNWPLAVVTLVGGYIWCRLFERHPNLITLALSHGWLAVILRYSWPVDWLRNLRIGPSYWDWGL